MLTKRQLELLKYIDVRIKEDGYSPSFDEMMIELELKSKSGVHRLIESLVERGFLRRLRNRARALEVVKLPNEEARVSLPHPASPFAHAKPRGWQSDQPVGDTVLPLMGRIAAGTPIEAISTRESDVSVPPQLVNGIGEHFALEVDGDSMEGAGIHHEDIIIVRRQETADNGEIIVALIRGEEATLKRLRCNGPSIALEAANPKYETRVYKGDEISVQGRLVGLIRRY